MKIKCRFKGSASHALYKPSNISTNTVILVVFCPLVIRASNIQLLQEQTAPTANLSQDPFTLQIWKESLGNLRYLELSNTYNKKFNGEITLPKE